MSMSFNLEIINTNINYRVEYRKYSIKDKYKNKAKSYKLNNQSF